MNFSEPGHAIIFSDCIHRHHQPRYLTRYAGPYRVATEMEDMGWTVDVIEYMHSFTLDELKKIIDDRFNSETKFVGFSITFLKERNWLINDEGDSCIGLSHPDTRELVKHIKDKGIEIVLGGNYNMPTDIPEAIFMPGIIEQKMRDDFNFTESKIKWKDDHHITEHEFLPIEIARGCIFKCKFCDYDLTGKKLWDFVKSPNIIREEMIENYERFGTTGYMFCDDCYNDDPKKVSSLLKMYKTLPFDLHFSTYARLDILYRNPGMIDELMESGLKAVFFGIESLNFKSAKIMGKPLHSDLTKQTLLDIKNKYPDLVIICSLIAGLPHDTRETITETMKWMYENDFNYKIQPLRLMGSMALNPGKYGYRAKRDSKYEFDWESDYWCFEDVEKFINEECPYPRYHGLFKALNTYINYRSVGIDHEKCLLINDMQDARYTKGRFLHGKTEEVIEKYKRKILNG